MSHYKSERAVPVGDPYVRPKTIDFADDKVEAPSYNLCGGENNPPNH
jgi:hypothetical protein